MEQMRVQKGLTIFKRFQGEQSVDLSKPIYFINQQGNEVIQSKQSMFILPIFEIALRMDKFKGVQQILQREYKKVQESILSKFQKIQGYKLLKVIQEQNMITYQNYQLMKYVDLNFIYYPEHQKMIMVMNPKIQELIKNEK